MEVTFSGSSILYAIGIALAVTVGTILFIFPRHLKSPNPWLGVAMYSFAWGLFLIFALESKLIYEMPHLYRTGNPIAILFMPASYLYVRNAIFPRPLTRWDILHLVPPLLFVIDFIPFYLLPTQEKLRLLTVSVTDLSKVSEYGEGWLFPPYFHEFLRYLVLAFYWILEINLLMKLKNESFRAYLQHAKAWRNWVFIFIGVQFLVFFPYFVGRFLNADEIIFSIVGFTVVASIVITAIGLLFRPEILYGLRRQPPIKTGNGGARLIFKLNQDFASKPSSNGQSSTHEIGTLISELMLKQKTFLRHKYTLQDMSTDVKIPAHQLSQYLNKHLNLSFNDCLNRYRIEHCLERIKNEDVNHLTLEAIAFECGFSNRNSFTTAFKKWTGKTPSDVLRRKRSLP